MNSESSPATVIVHTVHDGIAETRATLKKLLRSVEQPLAEMLENIDTIEEDHRDAGVAVPHELDLVLYQYRGAVTAFQTAETRARLVLEETGGRYVSSESD